MSGGGDRALCWAIHSNSPEGHGYLGIYYWFSSTPPPPLPDHVLGNRTATWRTRAAARAALKRLKAKSYVAFPKAAVRRIRITVEAA